jgi:hypothetical protein
MASTGIILRQPKTEDVSDLITKTEKLKQEIEQFIKRSFLTPTQREATKAGTNTALYLLKLYHTDEEEFSSNFGNINYHFTLSGSMHKGDFVLINGGVDYYNPDEHEPFAVRCDFDENELRSFLNQYTAKQKQTYWKEQIQDSIDQLDDALAPRLRFIADHTGDFDVREAIICQTAETADPTKLDKVIYELKRIKEIVKAEQGVDKQRPEKPTEVDRPKRRSRIEKVAAIATCLKGNPSLSSTDVEEATGIDATDVRHLWGPIKTALKEGKRTRRSGYKNDGKTEGIDESASCKICNNPLSTPLECDICKEIVKGECKTCHFTNTHPELAVP